MVLVKYGEIEAEISWVADASISCETGRKSTSPSSSPARTSCRNGAKRSRSMAVLLPPEASKALMASWNRRGPPRTYGLISKYKKSMAPEQAEQAEQGFGSMTWWNEMTWNCMKWLKPHTEATFIHPYVKSRGLDFLDMRYSRWHGHEHCWHAVLSVLGSAHHIAWSPVPMEATAPPGPELPRLPELRRSGRQRQQFGDPQNSDPVHPVHPVHRRSDTSDTSYTPKWPWRKARGRDGRDGADVPYEPLTLSSFQTFQRTDKRPCDCHWILFACWIMSA